MIDRETSLKRLKNFTILLVIFSLLGFVNSVYLSIAHYVSSPADICAGLTPNVDCDRGKTGEFSTIGGMINFFFGTKLTIPLPFGVVSTVLFTYIFITAVFIYKRITITVPGISISYKLLAIITKFLLIVTLFFGGLLVYTQAYLVMAWCLLCITLSVNFIYWMMEYYRGRSVRSSC